MKPTTTPYPAILTNSAKRLRSALKLLSPAVGSSMTARFLATEMVPQEHERLGGDFTAIAHEHQLAPERANSGADWLTWLILGGRGAGKTRAGDHSGRSLSW